MSFINFCTCFYDDLYMKGEIPDYQFKIITSAHIESSHNYIKDGIDKVFKSKEKVVNYFGNKFIKYNSIKLPLIRLKDSEYLINIELDYPQHLYEVLFSICRSTYINLYDKDFSKNPNEKCPSFETIQNIVGDFKMREVADIFKSEMYKDFENLIKDLNLYNKKLSFGDFLYAIALKNIHMTTYPSLEEIKRRRIKHKSKDYYKYIRHKPDYFIGLVPYRFSKNDEIEFLLKKTYSGQDKKEMWSLIKGKCDLDEDIKVAAIREFKKETGFNQEITTDELIYMFYTERSYEII